MSEQFHIIETSWQENHPAISQIRTTVFIHEQSVPEELEWDGLDHDATHLLVNDGNQPVATLRLLDSGHVGRVAVLSEYRRKGIATALMKHIEKLALKRDYPELILDAQTYIVPMYQKLGYKAEGEIFMDAGIPHMRMRKKLETYVRD